MTKTAAALRALVAAVIDRAILDLKGVGPPCRKIEVDRAMAFILSDTCEWYCLELGISHETVKERAAAFYCRELEKEKPPKIPVKTIKGVPPRQSPGEHHSEPLQRKYSPFSGASLTHKKPVVKKILSATGKGLLTGCFITTLQPKPHRSP